VCLPRVQCLRGIELRLRLRRDRGVGTGGLCLRRRVPLRRGLPLSFDRGDHELLLVRHAGRVERPACRTLRGLPCATADWWQLPLPLVAGAAAIVLLCLAG
jgi:hypothetical protein